jgi:hypothetical protein
MSSPNVYTAAYRLDRPGPPTNPYTNRTTARPPGHFHLPHLQANYDLRQELLSSTDSAPSYRHHRRHHNYSPQQHRESRLYKSNYYFLPTSQPHPRQLKYSAPNHTSSSKKRRAPSIPKSKKSHTTSHGRASSQKQHHSVGETNTCQKPVAVAKKAGKRSRVNPRQTAVM